MPQIQILELKKLNTRHTFWNSSYWNKRELNQLLPQNDKGLKGHFERFQFVFY